MTYEEAVNYILQQAAPHGLSHECLNEFIQDVNVWLERRINEHSTEPSDYDRWAAEALYEWDI